ncbi:MAG: serine hydrolase domain-containing protein [Nanoarchaeota archaeon]|nr:serine hydrolase domain-containing protein [Nanoarchaeota archaeon]
MGKILVAILLLIMFMFLISCAPTKPLTDEELKAELAKLTLEEREQLLADLESKESGAFAGQAIRAKSYAKKVSPRIVTVTPQQIQDLALKDITLPPGITIDQVKNFIYAQKTYVNQIEELPNLKVASAFQKMPLFDVNRTGQLIDEQLKDKVVGYELQVRQNDKLIYQNNHGLAQTSADQNLPWDENTRMNMASVTKFLAAVGLVKLLDSKGISYDAKIIDYLPLYWKKGQNIDNITFADLLTHKSGFVKLVPASTYFSSMRETVATGVTYPANPSYNNMNFDLVYILISIINGDISKDKLFLADNDKLWAVLTLQYYKNYMQNNVFTPLGITNADFNPNIKHALAYPFPSGNNTGFEWNDCSQWGGHCWVLSTKELLDVLDAVRFKNTVIPAKKAQYILDNKFGIDIIIDTPAGKIYEKNGGMNTASNESNKAIRSTIIFLPNNINIVAFANSPIDLAKVVLDALVASEPEKPKPAKDDKQPALNLTGYDGTWCFESDGSNLPNIKGYCEDNSGKQEDFCQSSNLILERYCTGEIDSKGWKNLKCLTLPQSCNNCSDGTGQLCEW